jgi:hypothetical protein
MSVRSVLNNDGVFNYAKAGSNGLSAKSLIITEGDLTFADGSTQSTASAPSTPSTWSSYPAISDIDAHFHAINNISEFNLIDNANNRQMLAYPFSLLLQNNGQASSTELYAPLSQNNNICFNTHNSNANASSIQMAVQPNNPTITLTGGANTSILSASAIQFNGVSLNSTVETNTGDIATNTADILTNNGLIATNTTDIATNTTNIATNSGNISTLQIKQTITTNQNISAVIYADAKPPVAPTTTIAQTYAFTPSWYFKNSFASNNKINWYIGADIGMTVGDVLGLYMNIFNGANTSNDNTPFIVFYTKAQAGEPTFYHSKRAYLFDQAVTPIANTRYFMFQNMTGSCPTPFHYGSTLNNMTLSTEPSSNVGPFLPTEEILAFSIQTNSGATINTVEFAINKFGIMTANGTQELAFIPL